LNELISNLDDNNDKKEAYRLNNIIGHKSLYEILLYRQCCLEFTLVLGVNRLLSRVVKKCLSVNEENRGPLSSKEFQIFSHLQQESEKFVVLIPSNIYY